MHELIQSFFREGDPIKIGDQSFPPLCVVESQETAERFLISDGAPTRAALDDAVRLGARTFIYVRADHDFMGSTIGQDAELRPYQIHPLTGTFAPAVEDAKAARFVHLHAHSEFSALDGLSTVNEMVERAASDGQPAIAITDHGVCSGHVRLQKAAEKGGVKPIFGIEAYLVDDRLRRPVIVKQPKKNFKGPEGERLYELHLQEWEADQKAAKDYYHLILWAQTDEGLKNLWGMSTEANRTGKYYRPRMDWDLLADHSSGIMASTACLRGPVSHPLSRDGDEALAQQNLARLAAIFDERLYVELHTNGLPAQVEVNKHLVGMADEMGLPVIAVSDAHYPCFDDREAHRVWIAVQTDGDLQDEADLFAGESDYHIMTADEVEKALRNEGLADRVVQEAMANTLHVADRCEAEIQTRKTVPVYTSSPKRDVERLVDLCMENWSKVAEMPDQPEYVARFEREMSLLIEKEFCGYFLMVSDYCRWARRNGILVGPGRGSGGGSLVAYLSGITGIDPIQHGLLFERFLTRGRTALPDFDVDFPTSKAEEIFGYVMDKYGAERVVRVGTRISVQSKGAIRDLARVLANVQEIHWPDVDKICELIDDAEAATAGKGLKWHELMEAWEEELAPWVAKYPDLFDLAAKMRGRCKTYGKHAAGLVIDPDLDLLSALPLRSADDQMVTEFDMEELEELGFLKFDFLFLHTLDRLQGAIDSVKALFGITVDPDSWKDEYLDPIPWEMLSDGVTRGVFQVEKPAGTRECIRFKPDRLSALSDVITLIRPGPKRSGITDAYFRRRFGQEEPSYAHPRLETVLDGTYGLMLYQEDVMNVCTAMAGYTLEESDHVRKILGKKKTELVEEEGRKFVEGCVNQGVERDIAERLWEQMAEFAKYSFNRSHALAYAVVGHWCAWFKAHYAVPFFAAVMSDVDKKELPDFVSEARRLGVKVLGPDINSSGQGFTPRPEQGAVRYGIDSVSGIAGATCANVLAGQPYESFDDFLERGGVDKGKTLTLVRVGAFDSIHPNRRELEARLTWEGDGAKVCVWKDEAHLGPNGLPCTYDWSSVPVELTKKGRPKKNQRGAPKRCTTGCWKYQKPEAPEFAVVEPYTDDQIGQIEREMLGVYLTHTPFDRIPADVKEKLRDAAALEQAEPGDHLVAALVSRIKPHQDRRGNQMAFLTLDLDGTDVDATVFSSDWKSLKGLVKKDDLAVALLRKQSDGRYVVQNLIAV
jgi:DNA polymerase-3 subunit alpha